MSINKGSEKGVSVIFISQLYRNNGYDIPKNTISTKGLLEDLKKKNWTKEKDYTKLQKGDICFTTVDNAGSPSHAYIFMGWVKEGKQIMLMFAMDKLLIMMIHYTKEI